MLISLLKKAIPGFGIAKEILTAAEWAKKGYDIMKNNIKDDQELTKPQVELVTSNDISFDLRDLIVSKLPQTIKDNINDKSKTTKSTLILVKNSLKDVDSILDKMIEVSDQIDKSIPD